jgi:hypothetical protein
LSVLGWRCSAAKCERGLPDRPNRVRRSILLGLEFLVAADIIRTVAVQPSLENVAVLGLIVLIRTFLSFSLEVEIDGRWPWRRAVAVRSGLSTPSPDRSEPGGS